MCVLSCSLVSNCLWPRGLLSPWNFPGCHSLLPRISLTQGSNQCFCIGRQIHITTEPPGNALI